VGFLVTVNRKAVVRQMVDKEGLVGSLVQVRLSGVLESIFLPR
jgi:hypothetical protein